MNVNLLLTYAISCGLVFLSTNTRFLSLIAGKVLNIKDDTWMKSLVGGLLLWFVMDMIWLLLTQGHLSFLIVSIGFVISFVRLHWKKKQVNTELKALVSGQRWAQIIVFVFTVVQSETIRWY
jgi:hypothetical protein